VSKDAFKSMMGKEEQKLMEDEEQNKNCSGIPAIYIDP
jgi:hypothetical protein